MTTNNTKHRMLVEAKKIANKKFSDYMVRNPLGNVERIIPASDMRDGAIRKIILDHPEFDEDKFKQMIKTFLQGNKGKEENSL